jgi:hypothetical protein
MAEVIFEGGKNPMAVQTWQDSIKLSLLESLYSHGLNLEDMRSRLFHGPQYYSFKMEFQRTLTVIDVDSVIREMFRDGSIEPFMYKCDCCKGAKLSPENVLDHVTGFRLTQAGRARIPEHIFP